MTAERLPQLELFSGEAADLRAYWPAPGVFPLKRAAPSGKACEAELQFGMLAASRCIHAGGWYRVNHVKLSVCRFHAAHLARRKGIQVEPDPAELAIFEQH